MGESALYFDKFNPNELADQIELLKENNALREDLIQAGKKLVKGLDPSKYFDQLEKVFDEFQKYRLLWGDRFSIK
jgi:glycosyltransferase involved in cell wall biosynthesis